MNVIHPSFFQLLKKYPHRREQIKALFKTDQSFKSICDDYFQCSGVLAYWSNSAEDEASRRMVEYERLLSELENEIEHYFRKGC